MKLAKPHAARDPAGRIATENPTESLCRIQPESRGNKGSNHKNCSAGSRREGFVSWRFKPSQPLGIILKGRGAYTKDSTRRDGLHKIVRRGRFPKQKIKLRESTSAE